MVTSRYLAMTAAELSLDIPGKLAYMACHFSPYTTGLSNIPTVLPPGSMLILNDRIPICGHDPHRIVDQLEQALENLACDSLLLDFQRPGNEETATLCRLLCQRLTCPLGISHHYARELNSWVFLPPPPLDIPLEEHLKPWEGRKIWLEAALEAALITVKADGCQMSPLPYGMPETETFIEDNLHCRYRSEVAADEIRFFLYRTPDQLDALLKEAGALGVETSVGLYQQLGVRNPLVG